ncbi:MAG: DUF3089 domain-containing protein [Saprospirales bacterium]|nr:DUF3089 domain-containing protein [Saprospirales bacterium]
MFQRFLLFFLGMALFASCAVKPNAPFTQQARPSAPDYSQASSWAALPDRDDKADWTPAPDLLNKQAEAEVDVFFLHPTIYIGKKGENGWNGPIDDPDLNERTDNSTIQYQASVFNETARVYAPRYRQAHLHSYFANEDSASAFMAFDLAYADVKRAFEYYMDHYNQGRPIIIASHSQGTTHAKHLLKDYFEGKPLQTRLVAAYLVGIPVEAGYFETIPPCETPEQVGCYCSWRSFKYGYFPPWYQPNSGVLATNPLLWNTSSTPAPKDFSQGLVVPSYDGYLPQRVDAQVHDGLLWIHKPKFPGSALFWRRNYHIADYNLFYVDIRENARVRTEAFLGRR